MRPDEPEQVVRIWRRSREDAQPWLEARMAHSDADDLRHFRDVVATENEVWVAAASGAPVALMALRPGFIDQLYVDPSAQKLGVGTALLDHAKRAGPQVLSLSPTSATSARAPSTSAAASRPSPSVSARRQRSEPDVRLFDVDALESGRGGDRGGLELFVTKKGSRGPRAEARRFVEALGAVVGVVHLEGDLARAALARAVLDLREQQRADPAPAVTRQHGQVVQVHERLSGERREPTKHTAAPTARAPSKASSTNAVGCSRSPLARFARASAPERRALAARLARVRVEDLEERVGLRVIAEVGAADLERRVAAHTSLLVSCRGWRPSTSPKAVLARELRGRPVPARRAPALGVGRERGDGAADELRALGVRQVEHLRGEHDSVRTSPG